jgi:hypothetical protein
MMQMKPAFPIIAVHGEIVSIEKGKITKKGGTFHARQ